jgi:hypothetical protein
LLGGRNRVHGFLEVVYRSPDLLSFRSICAKSDAGNP